MELSRRTILGASVATAASGLFGDHAVAARRDSAIGIQLYSVADDLRTDFEGTLKTLADIGYRQIEGSLSEGGRSPAELARIAACLGLGWESIHTNVLELQQGADRIFEQASTLGIKYVVCAAPWANDPSRIKPLPASDPRMKASPKLAPLLNVLDNLVLDDWKWLADYLNELGARAKGAGLMLGYHNHHYEFKKQNGVVPFDLLLAQTDPETLTFELDCGWAAYAGFDSTALLTAHPDRYRLLHLKDLPATQPKDAMRTTEVGSGVIDWTSIFAAARKTAVERWYVEQEPPFERPPLEAARISYRYLSRFRA